MTKLTVSLAQMSVIRSKPEDNLKKGEMLTAEAARRRSDIICFPEMWTTGFDWAANKRISSEQEKTLEIISEMARLHHIWINGSVLVPDEEGKMPNTSMLFDADGNNKGTYRKTHLFSLLHEEQHMAAGKSLCAVDTPWGLAGLSICYDVRFPELFRTYALKGVKLLFLPAAFPYPRLLHWEVLVRARAIENQMFVLATNQVGQEDFGKDGTATYFGNSVIVDPWGETVIKAGESQEILLTATIDVSKVDQVRSKMRVLKDRRPELYELT